MKTNDFLYLALLHRTLDYEKDPDPENWRTIKGAHVHVDNEGKIDGGAGGKFNGKGVLPRSLFPGQGKAKQTEFAEVTAKRKETEEAAKKAAAEAKERHKKELAEARKAKLKKQRELENRRPELKQKFNDLRESYHKETDAKKKKAIIKQLKEIESEYKDKFGKHPDDDNIKLPEKKATGSESERYEAKQKITEIHKTMRKLPYNAEREKLTEKFHKLYSEYTEKYGIEPPFDHPKKPKAKPAEKNETKSEVKKNFTSTYVNNIQSAVNKRKEIENRYRELAYAKTNSPEYSERRKLLEEKAKLQDEIDEAGKNILKTHAEKLKNVTQSNEKLNEKEVEQIQKDFEFVKKHVSEDSGLRDAVNQGMEFLKRVGAR